MRSQIRSKYQNEKKTWHFVFPKQTYTRVGKGEIERKSGIENHITYLTLKYFACSSSYNLANTMLISRFYSPFYRSAQQKQIMVQKVEIKWNNFYHAKYITQLRAYISSHCERKKNSEKSACSHQINIV